MCLSLKKYVYLQKSLCNIDLIKIKLLSKKCLHEESIFIILEKINFKNKLNY